MDRRATAKRREGNEIEFSRIVAFSDGVFSIAITLLVLGLGIGSASPTSDELADALWDQRENLLAYAISFAVIGRFWLVHHRFFSEVTAFDGRLIGLNMLYLGWIVLIPFSSKVLGEYGGQTPAVVLYSVNLAAVILIGWLMSADARRAGLTSIDDATHRESRVRTAYIASVFLLSIPVAFVDPHLAPYLWLVLFLDRGRPRRASSAVARAGDEGDRAPGSGAADRDALGCDDARGSGRSRPCSRRARRPPRARSRARAARRPSPRAPARRRRRWRAGPRRPPPADRSSGPTLRPGHRAAPAPAGAT